MKNLQIEPFKIKNIFRHHRIEQPRIDICQSEKNKANDLRNRLGDREQQIRDLEADLNNKRYEIEENHRKIEGISNLLHQANAELLLTKQQLSDALIIVAKYNELLPKYNQLLKDYEELQKIYNKTKAELEETKYMLNLNNETMNLANDISKHNSYQHTLEKTVIESFSEGFIEPWITENGNLPSSGGDNENSYKTYQNIKLQNDMLKNQIDKISNIYSADNQRAIYQTTNLEYQTTIYSYLLIAYYLLLVILIFLFYFDIKNVSRIVKVGIIIAIILYPWVIYLFEKFIYFIFAYLYSIVNGNVFFNDY